MYNNEYILKKGIILSKETVIKASQVIQMSNTITLLQRATWNHLLAEAYDDLLTEDVFRVSLYDLLNAVGIKARGDENSRTLMYFKDSIEGLNTTAVKWNILEKDKDDKWREEKYAYIPLLAGTIVDLKNGVIEYAFSPLIKKDLHNPKMYAKITLSMQNCFNSKHALALYEICLDYLDHKRGKGETPWIELAKYKELMGIKKDQYKEFKRLNVRLIKEPVNDINKNTTLIVKIELKREKRKVVALKFFVLGETSYQKALPINNYGLEVHSMNCD